MSTTLPVVDVTIRSEWWDGQPTSRDLAERPERYHTTIKAKELPVPPQLTRYQHGITEHALDVPAEVAEGIEAGDVVCTPRTHMPIIGQPDRNPPAVFDVVHKGFRNDDPWKPNMERLWVVEARERSLPANAARRGMKIREGIGRRDTTVPQLRYVGLPEAEPAAA